MTKSRLWPLIFLASIVVVGCGVPISAADLALTPEPTVVDITLLSESATAGLALGADAPANAAIRSLSASGLTPQPSIAPLSSATPGAAERSATPALTATVSPTPTATSTSTPFGTPPPTATPTPNTAAFGSQAAAILNKYRTDSGRAALTVDPALSAAAAAYARHLAETNRIYCGCDFHVGADGSQPEARMRAAGYAGSFAGEAITAGQGQPAEAINAWLVSPAHAAIVLSTQATTVGIGYFYKPGDTYSHYWVLITGK